MPRAENTGHTGRDHAGEPGVQARAEAAQVKSASTGWGRLWWRVGILPVLVLLPLVNQPLVADHRFNVFQYGGDLSRRPWGIITDPISTIPNYFNHGNFRPLGRMVEQGLDFLAFSLSGALDVPVGIALRVVGMLCVVLLCVTTVVWAETVSRQEPLMTGPPSIATLMTALGVPLLLVGTFPSAVVVFTALYFGSAALVLLVATAAARRDWFDSQRAGILLLGSAALVGACLAAFNEIAYLAAPLAAATVAARGLLTLDMSFGALVRTTAARVVLALGAGFVAVVVPVRLIIAGRCSDGGCYSPSALNISEAALPALGHRLLSAMPPTPWTAAGTHPAEWLPGSNVALLVLHALVIVLIVLSLRDALASRLLPGRGVIALALAGGALLVGAGAAMALTVEIQERVASGQFAVGSGWRENGLLAAGTALVVAAAGTALARLGGQLGTPRTARAVAGTLMSVLGVGAMITMGVNAAVAADQRPDEEAELFDRISIALLHGGPDNDAERCAMVEEFGDLHPNRAGWHDRLRLALESASAARHEMPFCSGGVADG